jgi:ABC-type Fe3+ transport system permease subunit
VGVGLAWVERELEEDALLIGPPGWVLWRVTLPRIRGVLVFAAVWLALRITGEITVAYVMEVGTLAEEVHIQFSQGRGALARAVATTLPLVLLTWGFLTWYLPRLERLPPLQWKLAEPRCFNLGAWRWPLGLILIVALFLLFGVPLASLFWKLGQSGYPAQWTAANAASHLWKAVHTHGRDLWQTLVVVIAASALIATSALLICWLADECRWFRHLVVVLLALAWSLPGPVVGISLKSFMLRFPDGLLADLFYFRVSPLPLAWAYVVRFLPFAMAILWPVVRLVPREPREAARLEGQGPWREFRTVVWPLTRRATFWCAVLVAALCLAEVAASTRAETPGWDSYVKLLFDRMHYGVENNVAAMSVLLLITIGVLAGFALVFTRQSRAAAPPPHPIRHFEQPPP